MTETFQIKKLFFILLPMLYHLHLQGQTSEQDDLATQKDKIDSIVKVINAYSITPAFKLVGKSNDGEYRAEVFWKPETELVRKITCTYLNDTTLKKKFFYEKNILLRIDFKRNMYYPIAGRIVNQEGSFVESAQVKELLDMGLWFCKAVGELR